MRERVRGREMEGEERGRERVRWEGGGEKGREVRGEREEERSIMKEKL